MNDCQKNKIQWENKSQNDCCSWDKVSFRDYDIQLAFKEKYIFPIKELGGRECPNHGQQSIRMF